MNNAVFQGSNIYAILHDYAHVSAPITNFLAVSIVRY